MTPNTSRSYRGNLGSVEELPAEVRSFPHYTHTHTNTHIHTHVVRTEEEE